MKKNIMFKRLNIILLILICLFIQFNEAQSRNNVINPPESIVALNEVYKQIAEKVLPSVVFIKVTRVVDSQAIHPFFRFFFRQDQEPNEQHRSLGVGSGVIINKQGYIVTNYHVIKDSNSISVVLVDNQEFKVQIVGVDEETDIAVLKMIGDVSKIKHAFLGDSDKVKTGEIVFALGNPFGLKGTITKGIVSATSRQAGESYGYDFIQTDAAINPGNSGGALVNIYGEVIGINRMIYTRTGGHMGIGFAIPINRVKDIVSLIIKQGKVTRGFLGVIPANPDDETSKRMKIAKGVRIAEVLPNSPASNAGLKPWDIILKINDKDVENFNNLKRIINITPPGTKIKITYSRNNKIYTVDVILVERDPQKTNEWGDLENGKRRNQQQQEAKYEIFGMELRNLTDQEKARLNIQHGVLVIKVKADTPSSEAGLMRGDIILEIESLKLNSVERVKEIIKSLSNNSSFQMRIKRGNAILFIVLEKSNK